MIRLFLSDLGNNIAFITSVDISMTPKANNSRVVSRLSLFVE